MTIRFMGILIFLFSCVGIARTEEIEVHVHDNFSFRLPADWKKVKVNKRDDWQIDTDAKYFGKYCGKRACLKFYTTCIFDDTQPVLVDYQRSHIESIIKNLEKEEKEPDLLSPLLPRFDSPLSRIEVWRIKGRVARVGFNETYVEDSDGHKHPRGKFPYQAHLILHALGKKDACTLFVYVFFKSDRELPMVETILKSINWYKDTAP